MIEGQNNSCINSLTQKNAVWEKRKDGILHCCYCGSITPDDALVFLVTRGIRYSGSDWKYGWPHKFYIGNAKFYSQHLADATEDQRILWNRVTDGNLEIKFWLRADEKLVYVSPGKGYQSAGTIGGTREFGHVAAGWFDDSVFKEAA